MNLLHPMMLNVSVVIYKHPVEELRALLETLRMSPVVNCIYIIDNSPAPVQGYNNIKGLTYFFAGRNLGYGAGHNIALRKSIEKQIPYHLVINPDIEMDVDVPAKLLNFMESNRNIGHLMPKIVYPDGSVQYLCKLLPTPADLLIRRFLPEKWVRNSKERFELRASGYNKIMDVPYLSGSFMFFRTEALVKVGLFDERFFMYPEDIDITRRIHRSFRTVFYPDVTVVHHHARSSYLNLKMLFIHLINMSRYFNKWGWIIDRERNKINSKTLDNIK